MRKILLALGTIAIFCTPSTAFPGFHKSAPPVVASGPVVLERGTPVNLQALDNFNSGKSAIGPKVRFRVGHDVKTRDKIVMIAKKTETFGFITSVQPASGKTGGRVTIHIDSVRAVDGQQVPLNFDWLEIGKDGASAGSMIAGALTNGTIGSNMFSSDKGQDAGDWLILAKNAATQADVTIEPPQVAESVSARKL